MKTYLDIYNVTHSQEQDEHGENCDLSDKLWTSSRYFSAINCKDFEEEEERRNIFHNFHHAQSVLGSFLRNICQDKSSCDSPFKK